MTATVQKALTKSQLSELALDAAIELDRMASDVGGSQKTVQNFLALVRSQLDTQGGSMFRDETLYPVYSFALSKAIGAPFTPREGFLATMNEMLSKYDDSDADSDEISYLKNFCLSVHEALISDLMGRRLSSVKQDERIR